MRLGVSGDQGSFSEEAGILYMNREGIEADIIYAIDMDGVLSRLDANEIELGIFPVVNSRGGLVQTAFEAMGRHLFTLISEVWMEVQQCLIALPNTEKKDLTAIATHPQAMSQCERYLKREFPNKKLKDWEDTAKAARDLAAGLLPPTTGVIAPVRAAQLYGLTVLEKGIQDLHPNLTTFIVVKK